MGDGSCASAQRTFWPLTFLEEVTMRRTLWNDPAADAVLALSNAEKPTWGCRCVRMTTPDRGVLEYTCADCTRRARAELEKFQNPSDDQLAFTNWGMF